jgi:hypothetical protein
MNDTIKTGVFLGLSCAGWTFVMGLTGWYKHPALLNLFWLVVVFEIAWLVWGLRRVAQERGGFGGLVVAGLTMALVGAGIVFASSIVFTTVAFPRYFEEIRAVQGDMMRAAGASDADILAATTAASKTQTPFFQALFGAIGTIVTGLVASLIIAAVVRKKPAG